jgi:sterol desaturase/sphingolipid hydroxylase (fatty acid hydroxylase superfamily)
MPTPLEILLDPISLTCLALYAALMLWEALAPARSLPRVAWWPLRGLTVFAIYFLVSSYLPLMWDATLISFRFFDSSTLPLWLQVLGGLLAYEFFAYWWHRTMHGVDVLWRSFHQFHHSAERLDTYGAFWFSPLDMAGFTFVSSFALVLVAGVSAEAAVYVLYSTFFLAVFQHANIETPQWVGYFVQRPESHSRHHGKGIHRDNYADLPVFDLLFGTFHNPLRHFDTGFYLGASSRILDMLFWRKVDRAEGKQSHSADLQHKEEGQSA